MYGGNKVSSLEIGGSGGRGGREVSCEDTDFQSVDGPGRYGGNEVSSLEIGCRGGNVSSLEIGGQYGDGRDSCGLVSDGT